MVVSFLPGIINVVVVVVGRHGFRWNHFSSCLEHRKNVGKMEVLFPEERNAGDAFRTKKKGNFLEERQDRLYFWRKGKIRSKLRENFPSAFTHAFTRLSKLILCSLFSSHSILNYCPVAKKSSYEQEEIKKTKGQKMEPSFQLGQPKQIS